MQEHVRPCIKIRRTTQAVSGACSHRAFSTVVDERYCRTVLALQAAKEAEQRGHRPGSVFVLLMQSNQRIENQEPRMVVSDGCLESAAVIWPVQAQRVRGNNPKRELSEIDFVMRSEEH